MNDEEIAVLHIDDDVDFLDLAETVLERDFPNIAVTTAESAEAGLDVLEETDFDCLVADYKMPGMDGLELLKRVRETHEGLPVIFFTGYGSEELAAEAIRMGVTDYVRKESTANRFGLLGNRIISLVKNYRADKAVTEATARELQVYERIHAGFFGVDDEYRLTYVNERAADIFDVDPEAVVGQVVWDVVDGAVGTPFESSILGAVEETEDRGAEFYFEPMDVWFDFYVYPDEDGASVYVEDVTEEVSTRRELEELRENLELTESEFRALRAKLSRPPSPFR